MTIGMRIGVPPKLLIIPDGRSGWALGVQGRGGRGGLQAGILLQLSSSPALSLHDVREGLRIEGRAAHEEPVHALRGEEHGGVVRLDGPAVEDARVPSRPMVFEPAQDGPVHLGGVNWGGAAADAGLGYLFVNSSDEASIGWVEKKPEGSPVLFDRNSIVGPMSRFHWSEGDPRIGNIPALRRACVAMSETAVGAIGRGGCAHGRLRVAGSTGRHRRIAAR